MTTSSPPSAGTPTPFNPLDFYNLAHQIAVNPSEACYRAAIGRVYYAMHLMARDHATVQALMSTYPRPGNMGSHEYIIYLIHQIPHKRTVGNKLRDLKDLRVQADYRMLAVSPYDNWQVNWSNATTLAIWLFGQIKAL